MAQGYRSIATLILGAGILFLGNGLLVTLLPVRAQLEDFSTTAIGLIGTLFYAGFALGCVIGPRVVKKVGHIRCFAGFAAIAAAAVLTHPLFMDPFAWAVLRAITGICFAMLYMVLESWLNEESTNEIRGAVLSIYIIVTNVLTIAGQLMLNLYEPTAPALFSLAAMLVALSLVPLCLTPTAAPKPVQLAKLDLKALFLVSPSGFIGCFLVGLVEAAFWALGPVFAQGREMDVAQITLFMSMFVVGGTLAQWPVGRLSDRVDRRLVIAACCLGAVCTGLAIAFVTFDTVALRLGLAILHGAFMIPIYPLCLAHANDFAPTDRLVETSSGLLLVYAAGAVIGPFAAAPLMDLYGDGMLFVEIATVLGLLALFSLYRAMQRPLFAALERVVYVPVPKTTPSVYALETDEDPEEEEEGDKPVPEL